MEQSNFQFALPSIGTDAMSRNDQGALMVNQATAVIVSSYLNYAATVYDNLRGNGSNIDARAEDMRITPGEIDNLINTVQGALRAF
jgi:hypothetical protein